MTNLSQMESDRRWTQALGGAAVREDERRADRLRQCRRERPNQGLAMVRGLVLVSAAALLLVLAGAEAAQALICSNDGRQAMRRLGDAGLAALELLKE